MISRRNLFRDFDKTMLLVAMAIFIMGLLFVVSATSVRNQDLNFAYVTKQVISGAIALALVLVIININYQRFIDAAWLFYGVNVVMLIVLIFVT